MNKINRAIRAKIDYLVVGSKSHDRGRAWAHQLSTELRLRSTGDRNKDMARAVRIYRAAERRLAALTGVPFEETRKKSKVITSGSDSTAPEERPMKSTDRSKPDSASPMPSPGMDL